MVHYRLWIKRLLRRIRFIFIDRTMFSWEYESCKHCGKCFRINWQVKDEIWNKVAGVTDGSGGSLCIDCFINIAEDKGIKINDTMFEHISIFLPNNGV